MPRTRPLFRITLTPTCEVLDDRECDCGQHSTYDFKGIEAPSKDVAVDLAYGIVAEDNVTRESHHAW